MLSYGQLYELFLMRNKQYKCLVVDYRPGPGAYTLIIELTGGRRLHITYDVKRDTFLYNNPDEIITEQSAALERLRQTLTDHPEFKQAFKETLEEMKQPANIAKMVDEVTNVLVKLQRRQGDTNAKK